jgi:hypothetical protein
LIYDDTGNPRILFQWGYYYSYSASYSSTSAVASSSIYGNFEVEIDTADKNRIAMIRKIPQEQFLTGKTVKYSGNIYLLSKGKIYYIFNDQEANLEADRATGKKKLNSYTGNKKSRVLYAYYSDKKEEPVRKAVTEAGNLLVLMPDAGVVRMEDGSALCLGKDDKQMVLVRIYIKEK